MPAVRTIAMAHDTLEAWPEQPDYLDHELATGTLVVSEDDGGITGFGAALERGGVHHLGDLFLRPGLEGRGAGAAMLAKLLPDCGRRTTFSSSDRRALALYARRGLVPVAPLLHLRGASAPPEWDDGSLEPTDAAHAAGLDAELRGYARCVDHEFLAGLSSVEPLAGERAFAYLRTVAGTTYVGPCGDLDATASTALAAVARAARRSPGVGLAMPGPHPGLRPLLDAGFRIVDVDTIMTSPPDLLDWRRIVPDTDLG
jgi:GNAT superfamily N-acetyltransferase